MMNHLLKTIDWQSGFICKNKDRVYYCEGGIIRFKPNGDHYFISNSWYNSENYK